MSRQQLVVAASVALALGAFGASFTLAACGGSASETPPPLEPDPRGFHYAPAVAATTDDSDAGDAPRTIVPGADDDEPKPRSKASSTWGGGKPAAK